MDFVLANKMKLINEKLWNHGVLIGHMKGELEVNNSPFIKQIMLGVRTEQGYLYIYTYIYIRKYHIYIKGIKVSSSVFYRDEKEEAKNALQKEVIFGYV